VLKHSLLIESRYIPPCRTTISMVGIYFGIFNEKLTVSLALLTHILNLTLDLFYLFVNFSRCMVQTNEANSELLVDVVPY